MEVGSGNPKGESTSRQISRGTTRKLALNKVSTHRKLSQLLSLRKLYKPRPVKEFPGFQEFPDELKLMVIRFAIDARRHLPDIHLDNDYGPIISAIPLMHANFMFREETFKSINIALTHSLVLRGRHWICAALNASNAPEDHIIVPLWVLENSNLDIADISSNVRSSITVLCTARTFNAKALASLAQIAARGVVIWVMYSPARGGVNKHKTKKQTLSPSDSFLNEVDLGAVRLGHDLSQQEILRGIVLTNTAYHMPILDPHDFGLPSTTRSSERNIYDLDVRHVGLRKLSSGLGAMIERFKRR